MKMSKLESFKEKYGFNPLDTLNTWSKKYLDNAKRVNFNNTFEELVQTNKSLDGMFVAFAEVLQEQEVRLAQGVKMEIPDDSVLSVSPQNPSVPKSKGLLEDFKNIVDLKNPFRKVMGGVYSDENILVGTDAHVLVVFSGANQINAVHKKETIDLEAYLKSKGDVVRIIDEKYPNYEQVIPSSRFDKTKINLYEVYNYAVSASFYLKLVSNPIVNIQTKIGSLELNFNPLLFANLCAFWICKGKKEAYLEHSDGSNKAVVMTFDDNSEDLGLIMPVSRTGYSSTNVILTEIVEFDKLAEFSGGKKSSAIKKTLKASKSEAPKDNKSSEEFKKYSGNIKEANYIPRREIDKIILKNGKTLTTNDIIDGIYVVKSKMSYGGRAKYAQGGSLAGKLDVDAVSFGIPIAAQGKKLKYKGVAKKYC